MKLEFAGQILEKNAQISKSMKIRPLVAELHHEDGRTDGRTDMINLIVAFRNFAKAPKNCQNPDTIASKWPRF